MRVFYCEKSCDVSDIPDRGKYNLIIEAQIFAAKGRKPKSCLTHLKSKVYELDNQIIKACNNPQILNLKFISAGHLTKAAANKLKLNGEKISRLSKLREACKLQVSIIEYLESGEKIMSWGFYEILMRMDYNKDFSDDTQYFDTTTQVLLHNNILAWFRKYGSAKVYNNISFIIGSIWYKLANKT